jgi:hypothetical protein
MPILTEHDGAVKLHSLAGTADIGFKGKYTHRFTFGNKIPLSLGASFAHEEKADDTTLQQNRNYDYYYPKRPFFTRGCHGTHWYDFYLVSALTAVQVFFLHRIAA